MRDEDRAHSEVELKLLASPEDVPRLRRHARLRELSVGRPRTQRLETVYFDTPDLALRRAGLVLRVRRAGRSLVQSVKTSHAGQAGLFTRGEWEERISGPSPDLEAVPDPEIRARIEEAASGQSLVPVLRTEIQRTSRLLRRGEDEIECDLDLGEVVAGDERVPVCELELELVRGDPGALYDLALELQQDVELRPAARGKADEGFARLTGGLRPQKARRPDLDPDSRLDDALACVTEICLEQILANEAVARTGQDPEGVHQMRVGVRRLRSALALFRGILPSEPLQAFRQELRWLGGELGGARDLDVFLNELLAPIASVHPEDSALKRVRDEARALRDEEYRRAHEALASRRYTELVLRLGGWAAGRRWREQGLSPQSARLFSPASELAGEILERRWRKARRMARGLTRASREQRHALRIQLKKLRYAAELFRGLYPAGRADRAIRRLSRLQDVLGHLNDQATAEVVVERLLDRLGDEAGHEHVRAAGFVVGWASSRTEEALRDLPRRWKRFARLEPFWTA